MGLPVAPWRRLLVGVRELQHLGVVEAFADDLDDNGRPLSYSRSKPTSLVAGDVERYREVRSLQHAEFWDTVDRRRFARRGGGHDDVEISHCPIELGDQFAAATQCLYVIAGRDECGERHAIPEDLAEIGEAGMQMASWMA